jgi:ADP-ribose pyrophosphatase YjhB (NUDIX family)
MYKLPGGQSDGIELPLETLKREVEEEVGLKILGADEVYSVKIPGHYGEHDFIVYFVRTIEGNIKPGSEILVVSLLTIEQVRSSIAAGRVLSRHANALNRFLAWREMYLSENLLREIEEPEKQGLEIHIYKAPATIDLELSPDEQIDILDGGICRAVVLPKTAARLLDLLAAQNKFEPKKVKRIAEPIDDDFLYGRKTPVRIPVPPK